MKPVGKDIDELCYPFIYEESHRCDYEIITDELCSRIGLVLSKDQIPELVKDVLSRLQPNTYHLNGSVRGKLAITEDELIELKADYERIKKILNGGKKGFVLPGGHPVASELHLCRSLGKKTVRALVAVHQEGRRVPPDDILFRYANLITNVFYALASYTNMVHGVEETPFISKSYPMPEQK